MSEAQEHVTVKLAGAEVPSILDFSDVKIDFVEGFIRLYRGGSVYGREEVAVFGSGQLISLVVA